MTVRTAVVTGAAGDIGQAVATQLAASGTGVVLADRPEANAELERGAERCRSAGAPSCTTVCFDVTDDNAVRAAFSTLAATDGPPQLLVNNAGYQGEFANIVDASPVETARVLAVNVGGVMAVLQAFATELRAADLPGAVVNTASMAGVGGAPNMAAYSASKGAVIALTKSAAKDLAPHRIRVNAVSPGFIGPGAMWDNQVQRQAETPSPYYADDNEAVAHQMLSQIPLGRYGGLDEVAEVICFLLSDQASYLTGTNIEISGGAQ